MRPARGARENQTHPAASLSPGGKRLAFDGGDGYSATNAIINPRSATQNYRALFSQRGIALGRRATTLAAFPGARGLGAGMPDGVYWLATTRTHGIQTTHR